MTDSEPVGVEQSPALQEITAALVEELQEKLPQVRVIRNGELQITLFRPVDYNYAQIVVGSKGVHVVFNPTKDVPDEEVKRNIRGPYPLEDPNMFNHLYGAIEQWEKTQRS